MSSNIYLHPKDYVSTPNTMEDRTPYCYLIGWSHLNKFYYGRRTAKSCHPSDLFVKYFTSSKVVKQYILDHGNPDIIQIRKVFDCVAECVAWENKILTRINATKTEKFLNKTNGDKKFDVTGMVSVIEIKSNLPVTITKENYNKNRKLYKHYRENMVSVRNTDTDEKFSMQLTDFYSELKPKNIISISENRVSVTNKITNEISFVDTGTKINRDLFYFNTGKPIGTTESDESRRRKSNSGKNKLTVRNITTGECIRLNREASIILVNLKSHTYVTKGTIRTDEQKTAISERIKNEVLTNRVCDIITHKEYSTSKFLARDKSIETRKLNSKINRVCRISDKKEIETRYL